MKTPLLLLAFAILTLIGSLPFLFAHDAVWLTMISVVTLLAVVSVVLSRDETDALTDHPTSTVGVGTVRSVDDVITVDVENVTGQTFVGRLRHPDDDGRSTSLRPGAVLLVTFDPEVREQVSLAGDDDGLDMPAVRAAFDRMLVTKGLLTTAQVDLIRGGVKTTGVVTGRRSTGDRVEDHREMVVNLMVHRPGGGQFPAHETTLVPAGSLHRVSPGSVVDVYYRGGDESTVAICVQPR